MRLVLLAAICAALLSACGTMPYQPSEYPLRDGLISELSVRGDAKFVNSQSSTEPAIVYSYGGTKLSSDLRSITEVMTQQANKELAKAAVRGAGDEKRIELKVTFLESKYVAFFWKSQLNFEATLGNGKVVRKTVTHGSGVLLQDLNGCIAESVMHLLNDEQVRSYLAERA